MKFVKSKWWFIGFLYGFLMWLFVSVFFRLAEDNSLVAKRLVIELVIWFVVGMIIGRLIVASNQESVPKQG